MCYLIAIPSCGNESDLNKIRSVSILLHCITFTNFLCSLKKNYNIKLKKGGALHFINIHHGQINITQCMHTYDRYHVLLY